MGKRLRDVVKKHDSRDGNKNKKESWSKKKEQKSGRKRETHWKNNRQINGILRLSNKEKL